MLNKAVITGGDGRFAQVLKNINKKKLNIFYPNKKELNILDTTSITKYLKKNKPTHVIHAAALSRPMNIHDQHISKSIDMNIIGTCNIVKVCSKLKIKLIYFSTGYVYEGKKGNYKEDDPIKPINNYAWSKLGGECAVAMYKNSLILRITMCEKPFIHKHAFHDVITNFIFHEEVAKIIPKILDKKGILNVGGKTQSIYSFAKKFNKDVKKKSAKGIFPKNPSMNTVKLKKIVKW
ncbi:sugar nucleotide-binding protein [Candidatus Pelagibacter sp. Uisw_092]|uniref:sugar nucleotide-binding protein n=1 Tax=Candidatus Pelagibacter sp. Uisw_092 TaxID=3230979 RepID=UPI0039EA64B0